MTLSGLVEFLKALIIAVLPVPAFPINMTGLFMVRCFYIKNYNLVVDKLGTNILSKLIDSPNSGGLYSFTTPVHYTHVTFLTSK